ncbi:MAG: hypothetical protein ABS34_05640 [Opitutaceae bacterium BACL24 MAG-120322-bin51]|nr:MAG: hypothetical protein ABS34_05640 [Opitutaceae bacterium BACL24 MAG-120322-bin51]
MMQIWRTVPLAITALISAAHLYGNDVILRLTPSFEAAIIAKIDARSPLMQSARPVLEADKAQQGWKWLEYTATLDGYILSHRLSKNFDAAPNSLVRLEPNQHSQVLTTIQRDDIFEIIARNDTWSTIRFRKAVPVYFNSLAIPNYTADQVPGHALPQRLKIDPNSKVANVAPNALRPENIKWHAAPPGTPTPILPKRAQPTERVQPSSIMTGADDQQESELPQRPEVQADSPLRNLAGTLVREMSHTGPRFPIRLKSPTGQQTAYVDMTHLFINDLRPLLNQKVQIIGEVRPVVAGSQDLIIQARTIRLAE